MSRTYVDRRPRRSSFEAVIVASCLLCVPSAGFAEETGSEQTVETEVQRIETLWAELESLLSNLPETRRQLVHKTLTERLENASKTVEPAPQPAEPEAQADLETASPAGPPSPSSTVERPAESPTTRAPTVEPTTTPERAPLRKGRCNSLDTFDTDGDGALTALDRYWRHLYLWLDRNGDGEIQERELVSPYDKGIRRIGLDLRHFERGKKKKARRLPMLEERFLLLDLDGDGFDGLRPSAGDGALAVDFGAVQEAGGPVFNDASRRPVDDIRPLLPGWSLIQDDGTAIELRCPKP